jgi:uncharacterized protein (TIGR02145 family)
MNIFKSLIAGVFVLSICAFQCGIPENTVKDADGNKYKTIQIGNQVWMAKNLRTTKYNDGSPIPQVKNSVRQEGGYLLREWELAFKGAYCFHNNTTNKDTIEKFGAHYNWYVVNTGKLAPKGWHVPTVGEWNTLQNYLIMNGYNWDGTTTGNKTAKSISAKTDWLSSEDVGAIGNDLTKNNNSGFSALPGGCRENDGRFWDIGRGCYWWSATDASEVDSLRTKYQSGGFAFRCYLDNSSSGFYISPEDERYGFSIRLIKDEEKSSANAISGEKVNTNESIIPPEIEQVLTGTWSDKKNSPPDYFNSIYIYKSGTFDGSYLKNRSADLTVTINSHGKLRIINNTIYKDISSYVLNGKESTLYDASTFFFKLMKINNRWELGEFNNTQVLPDSINITNFEEKAGVIYVRNVPDMAENPAVSGSQNKEELSEFDLLNGILIDGQSTFQLKNGGCDSTIDEDKYSYGLDTNFIAFAADKKSAAVIIGDFSGIANGGNGFSFFTGYAIKNNGKTSIRIGDKCGGNKANIKYITYTDNIIKIVKNDWTESKTESETEEIVKIFKIVNNVPVLKK